jgi:hypothetical protein
MRSVPTASPARSGRALAKAVQLTVDWRYLGCLETHGQRQSRLRKPGSSKLEDTEAQVRPNVPPDTHGTDATQSARRLSAESAHLENQLTLQVARFAHAMCFAGVGELVPLDRRWSHRTDVEEGEDPLKMDAVT